MEEKIKVKIIVTVGGFPHNDLTLLIYLKFSYFLRIFRALTCEESRHSHECIPLRQMQ
jgi:hypothetical protein